MVLGQNSAYKSVNVALFGGLYSSKSNDGNVVPASM